MRGPYTQLYAHCVWATWERLPLITPEVEPHIYSCIHAKCEELGCYLLAIGGVQDHVHILVRFPPALSLAKLVGEVKGASSHLMSHRIAPGQLFRWQGAYGAFTVARGPGVEHVTEYVRRHARRSTTLKARLFPIWRCGRKHEP